MNKKIEDLTREELERLAADLQVAFDEAVSDSELRDLVEEAFKSAEPVTPEDVEGMDREQLKEVAAGLELNFPSKIGTDKLKERVKAALFPVPAEEKAAIKTAEAWATEKRTPSWQLAALKQANKWAEGKSLTEAEYIKGLEELQKRPLGR